jgi:hypothetical protein
MSTPGPGIDTDSSSFRAYYGRLGYVKEALEKCWTSYAEGLIIEEAGEELYGLLVGFLVNLMMMFGVLVVSAGVGAATGAAIGSLAAGVGAMPGAVVGAKIGLAIGNGLLTWLGLAFLLEYVGEHLRDMGARFQWAIRMAWDSDGEPAAVDAAARVFAEGVSKFVGVLLQGLVVAVSKGAPKQGFPKTWAQVRNSRLFKRCPGLEPWLIKNFARLRTKYWPLTWTLLEQGPLIENTSIPEWIVIKVGERVFWVWREKTKPAHKPPHDPIGPAMKHPAEQALHSQESPTVEQATKKLQEQVKSEPPDKRINKLHPDLRNKAVDQSKRVGDQGRGATKWAKSPWSHFDQSATDFPLSAIAAALDQAEAQLIFKPPGIHKLAVDNWELVIDTTTPRWRVQHAHYTDHPWPRDP